MLVNWKALALSAAAALDRRLHRALQLPLAAEAELEARAEGPAAELAEVGTEAGAEGEEGLLPDLPAGGELGERAGRTGARGDARPDLDQIDRHAEVLDQGALQLAGERAREVGEPRLQGVPCPTWAASFAG